MGYEVSGQTARKIKSLLGKGQSTGTPSSTTAASGRYDTHVRITGLISGGYWPCVPCYFDPVADEWVEFDAALALASNSGILEVDRRYRAINYGKSGDTLVFAVDEDTGTPFQPVHVQVTDWRDESGYYPCVVQIWDVEENEWVSVLSEGEEAVCFPPNDYEALAPGNRYHANLYGIDNDVLVYVTQEVGKVWVTVTGPVGDGGWYPCSVEFFDGTEWETLDEDAYCAEPQERPLVEDTRYIAYQVGEDEDGRLYFTQAREDLACGLEFIEAEGGDNGKIKVDIAAVVEEGNGLVIEPGATSADCDKLKLEVGECGFRVDENGKLQLDLEGICYEAIKGVNEDGGGCSISLRYDPCYLDLAPDPLDVGEEMLTVKLDALAGPGLEVYDRSSLDPEDPDYCSDCCPALKVTASGSDGTYHVLVTSAGPDGVGWYTCSVQQFDPDTLEWVTIVETAYCAEPNERRLVNGTRYLGQYYGEDEDGELYYVQVREDLGCGLEISEDDADKGKIVVVPSDIAGCGLKQQDGDEEECNKLAVDVEALAGDGLEVQEDECDKMRVKVGDGLKIDEDGAVAVEDPYVCFRFPSAISCEDGELVITWMWFAGRGVLSTDPPVGCGE